MYAISMWARQACVTKIPQFTPSLFNQPRNMSDPNIEGRIFLAFQDLQNDPKLKLRRAAEIYKAGRMIL
jgi:hypothetical protein